MYKTARYEIARKQTKKYSTKNVGKKNERAMKKEKTERQTHQMVQVPNAYLTHPIRKANRIFCARGFLFLET